jgi:hypothetical protein
LRAALRALLAAERARIQRLMRTLVLKYDP